MRLRDYQEEALADLEKRFGQGATRVPQVLATGLGKTQIFASYAARWLDENAGRRVLIVAHTNELIEQAAKRARQIAPMRRIGIVKAEQNEIHAEIVVSSRQTLASKARRGQLKNVGLIVIDEAHHAVRTNTYGKILDHFGAFDNEPAVRVVGYTATLIRSDKAKLSSVWEECSFTRDILFGIRNGYLLDVRGERIVVPDFDMSRIGMRSGDYSDSDIGEELERTFAPEVIAKKYAQLTRHVGADVPLGPTYRRGLAFWPLVATAFHGAEAFAAEGIRSAVVHGGTPKIERRALLQRFHLPLVHPEAIDVMHNAMVLTEGFDEPSADVVVIARPTRAAGLYQQMVGRVLRPDLTIAAELREKALILDVVGAGEDHDLRSLIDLSPERRLRVGDGQEELSLAELDDVQIEIEEEIAEQRAGATYEFESDPYRGPVATKTFDPLGRDKVWGRTPAGHYYIKAGSVGFVFLVEADAVRADAEANTYDVVMCSTDDGPTRWNNMTQAWQRGTEHRELPLDMALSWGEELAAQIGGAITLNSRKSSWRKKEPSDSQKRLAAVYRVNPEGMNSGELSEAVDAAKATRRIDPLVAFVTQAQKTTQKA
jgi:superfamily II DNA or RNA helicase